ncbi:leucine rich repeat (LRR) protein [Winogradskyella wandonensis]|uniref:Leucine rich repeat (LRR) protein n=1 Tax=Winogradskyella wandonensis TaxID=1442586 RepID=A0A4R1KU88_9FLAO|nr:leucine-rich repeat protein [Winogradskyella wandonensis]TCK68768.1 leucine rich repeat (LRR) protein [Winogradskyella wandonensis]
MKNFIRIALLFVSVAFFFSCEKDPVDLSSPSTSNPEISLMDEEFQAQNFGNSTTANFIGTIKNTSGDLLSDVQIEIDGVTTTTDRNGIFILNNAPVFENFAYIKAKKQGYIDGSRVVIPKETGTNNIQIVLFEKETTATINSGEPSVVSKSGAKVSFTGDFIREDGSEYNGEVEVVLNYLTPFYSTTFREMPGSLFAQTADNEARGLESYGMVSVNLFSPSGEILNINEANPANIEFPISFYQNDVAPESITLWYFDEEQGYWKEDGQAVKDGNKYIANVTHFTWWNCDIPFNSVEFCYSINPEQANASTTSTPYNVSILRVSNGQVIFSGTVYSDDDLTCGLVPRNEEIEIIVRSASGSCQNLIVYQDILGGFMTDTTVNLNFSQPQEVTSTNINGFVTNCIGNPLTNGYVYIDGNNIFSITDGVLDIEIIHCIDSMVNIQIYDFDTNQWTIAYDVSVNGASVDLGNVSTCEDTGGIFNGDVTLRTQEEVDFFGNFDYNQINGNLLLGETINNQVSNINNLAPLSSINSVTGFLTIRQTELINLQGLENITVLNVGLSLFNNDSLSSLNGLNNLTTIGGQFNLRNNNSLNSLETLSSLQNISSFTLENSPNITSLEGLNQVTNYDWFRISNNDGLTDLSALINVTEIGALFIAGNDSLESLNGLDNVIENIGMFIGRDLDFDIFVDLGNSVLTDFCALQNLFVNGNFVSIQTSPFNGIHISNNQYNPSIQDIIDGNCSQ